jgi:hypothetical protein
LEVTEEWRRLHKEELYDLYVLFPRYCSGDQVKNEMGRTCGTFVREEGYIQGFEGGEGEYLRERGHLGDLNLDEKIILKCIVKMRGSEAWTGLIWLRIGTGDGHLLL